MLAMSRDANITYYCQQGSGTILWSPAFIRDAFPDDILLAAFLNQLNEINYTLGFT